MLSELAFEAVRKMSGGKAFEKSASNDTCVPMCVCVRVCIKESAYQCIGVTLCQCDILKVIVVGLGGIKYDKSILSA